MNLAKQYNLLCNGNIILFILFLHHILYKPAFTVVLISSVSLLIWGRYLQENKLNLLEGQEERQFWQINSAFVLSLIIASCFSSNLSKSMYMALEYIYWWLPYFVMLGFLNSERAFKSAYMGLVVAAVFISNYAIYQRYALDMIRPPGFYPNPNSLAACIELLLPALLLAGRQYLPQQALVKKILLSASILLTIWGLLLTESRGAVLGLVGAFTIYIFTVERKNKELLKQFSLVLGGIVLIIALFIPQLLNRIIGINFDNLNADMGRKLVMQSSFNMWQDHKLFGIGLGNFQQAYESKYVLANARERHLGTAHNAVLHYLAETGIFTTLLYLAMMGWHLWYMYKHSQDNLWCKIMLVTILAMNIHSLAEPLYTVKPINRMYWCLLGIAVASIRYKKAVEGKNDF